ncbi:hypothetical protein ROE7235_03589 [Roseibaca ekhonensis]|uniref:Uncharacterized protein n=1 Tax=Roseinatronobacter ekhonensis TaxID=254356 RepID=A0A3B0MYM7_9RHOB|nr:hypothetical protein [Roseibaca ekhonensis]SUZ33814.1 hypothetical protein ROE7235_03589 [Roseibaca ekhonensis]
MKPDAIVRYVRDLTDTNGKLSLPGGRGFEILNTVIETFKSVNNFETNDVLPQDLISDLMKRWLTATRSISVSSPEFSNTVLHWADYKRLGLIGPDGAAVIENVQQLAQKVFATDTPPSFDNLVVFTDRQKFPAAKQDGAPNKALKALLKKKRKQGKLNRKRSR